MLGTVYGKTSTTKFNFIVEGSVNKWDYVAVNHPELGPILNQVSEIEKEYDKTIAKCQIIGYRTERNFLRQPRTPLEPGSEVYIAKDDLIKSILDLRMNGIYLGKLQGKDIQAYLDPKKLVTKHLAVLAKSGAGKSYAVGVILEELLEMGLPIVILDPHGEYSSIKYENKNSEETKYFKTFGISGKGFSNKVMEFAVNTSVNIDAHPIRLPIPNDSFSLMESLPFKPTDAQRGLLYNVVNDLVERKGVFEFDELIKELEIAESTAKWRLIGGIQQLEQSQLFSHGSTNISDIVKPGQLSIINFKGASSELQEIVARGILNKIFDERKKENIPPTFIVVDEAHNYCPERGFGETKSSKIIRTIAAEGRKFGVGLCVISQRPARVDKSVLSQCSSQIALQVSNPSDLSAISKSFEGITSEAESEIKNLPIGKAMIIGATDFPIFVDIRVRKSQHGGAAKSFSLGEAKKAVVKSNYVSDKPKKIEKEENNNSTELFIFEPKINRKELETLENNVDSVSYELNPVISTIVSKNNRNFHLVFDLQNLSIYKFDGKLTKTRLSSSTNLSPIQNKIYNLITKNNPLSEIFVKSGLSFSEFNDTLNTLSNQKIISVENKIINKLDSSFNLGIYNFPIRPKYNNLNGKIRKSKINFSDVQDYLQNNGFKVLAHRNAYIPFFKVKTGNKNKIIDSLSYNLEI
ncbi:MAG: ATP-binding protein [Candidatus Woesearchaeota archaeon]